jgi:hypothetical protein
VNKNCTFTHENKTFEIRVAILDGRFCVKVFLDGAQVSPEYSATLEVGQDYFSQHQESIVAELAKIAEADVRRGIYLQA